MLEGMLDLALRATYLPKYFGCSTKLEDIASDLWGDSVSLH